MTAADSARILIVAGEASGDLYGGLLMRAMESRREGAPSGDGAASPARFLGVGGPRMRSAGLQALGDAGRMAVTGIFEVFRHLRIIRKAFNDARGILRDGSARPDLAILIDYPDFNLRLARHARRAGVPVLYLVSPQIWAWRKGRLRQIRERVDRMLVILPFEPPIYQAAGVPVEFIGHPLVDLVRPVRTRRQSLALLGFDPDRPVVALLPGSRRNELAVHLPPMMEAARILKQEFLDLQFLLPVAPTLERSEVDRCVRRHAGPASPRPVLVTEDRYDAIASADAAIVASGTATVETTILGVPMVIVYRMNPVTYALARLASDVPHIGMPSLIAGERVVPELVQGACRGDRIAREVRRILTEPSLAREMRARLARVKDRLGRPGAIERAASAAWDMIRASRAGAAA
jgi:lipid-A-disaccharide synthase